MAAVLVGRLPEGVPLAMCATARVTPDRLRTPPGNRREAPTGDRARQHCPSPVMPGEVLLEEFMCRPGLTARALGAQIDVPGSRISSIVNGLRAVTVETAILLGRRFGTGGKLWMNLQTAHDMAVAQESMSV